MPLTTIRTLSKVMMASICTILILTQPLQVLAQEGCYDQNECEYCDSSHKGAWLLGGVVIVGGVIGLLCSQHHHSGSKGSHGSTGVPGPQGPVGANFTADIGQTLDFALSLEYFTSGPNGITYTVIPFIVTPNGTLIEGDSQQLTTTVNIPVSLGTISVSDPLFGVYKFGVSMQSPDGNPTTYEIRLRTDTTASRDGSITTVMATVFTPGDATVVDLQYILDYTYSPLNPP